MPDEKSKKTCSKGNFFKLLFGYPMAKFGPLLREQLHAPDVNHSVS